MISEQINTLFSHFKFSTVSAIVYTYSRPHAPGCVTSWRTARKIGFNGREAEERRVFVTGSRSDFRPVRGAACPVKLSQESRGEPWRLSLMRTGRTLTSLQRPRASRRSRWGVQRGSRGLSGTSQRCVPAWRALCPGRPAAGAPPRIWCRTWSRNWACASGITAQNPRTSQISNPSQRSIYSERTSKMWTRLCNELESEQGKHQTHTWK